ncbi:MAG: AAA family ATPase [Thalassobaculum sp.]|uniref:AAA family ATPase n=1 Tax=Thalassobaculum sp. TaxID=2022740 RepID=UPI0032EC81D4
MDIQIVKAQRKKAKLRVGIFGPSGSGKTMSALKLANGLTGDWQKVCVIDTENNSAHLYSHLGQYSVLHMRAPYTPESYIEAIHAAEKAGYEAIIIDSITHEWAGEGGILELSDALGKDAKSSYTVWAKLTPRHNKFIETILQSPAHVICCGRSKQDYALNQVEKNGKTVSVPEKIGLKAVTREGFDYEMTVAFDLTIAHYAISTKDRTGLFQDKPEHIISEETGRKLFNWNETGAETPIDVLGEKNKIKHNLARLGFAMPLDRAMAAQYVADVVKVLTELDLSVDKNLPMIVTRLEAYADPEGAQATYGLAVEEREKAAEPAPEPANDNATSANAQGEAETPEPAQAA